MITAYATNGAAAAGGIGSMILPLALMFALMYFLMIKPQKKRQKQAEEMRNSLKTGDKVTLYGGMTGTIVAIRDDIVTVETGPDKTRLDFNSWGIMQVITDSADGSSSMIHEDAEDDKEFERKLFGDGDSDEDDD